MVDAEIENVGFFVEGDAWVLAEGWVELVGAFFDGGDVGCAATERKVGEAAGGAADVEDGFVAEVDTEKFGGFG